MKLVYLCVAVLTSRQQVVITAAREYFPALNIPCLESSNKFFNLADSVRNGLRVANDSNFRGWKMKWSQSTK